MVKKQNYRPLAKRGKRVGDEDDILGFLANRTTSTYDPRTGYTVQFAPAAEGRSYQAVGLPNVPIYGQSANPRARYINQLADQISRQGGAGENNDYVRMVNIITNAMNNPNNVGSNGELNQKGWAEVATQQHFGGGSNYRNNMNEAGRTVFNTGMALTALPSAIYAPGALARGIIGGTLGELTGEKVGRAIGNLTGASDRTSELLEQGLGLTGGLLGGGWLANKSNANLRNAAIRGAKNYRNQNRLYSTPIGNNKPTTVATTSSAANTEIPKPSTVNISRKSPVMTAIEKGKPVSVSDAVNDTQFMQQYQKYINEANNSVEGGYDPVLNFSRGSSHDPTLQEISTGRNITRPDVRQIGIPTVAFREGYDIAPYLNKDRSQIILSPDAASSVSRLTPEQFNALRNTQLKLGLNPATPRQALDNSLNTIIALDRTPSASYHSRLNEILTDQFDNLLNQGLTKQQIASNLGFRDYNHMINTFSPQRLRDIVGTHRKNDVAREIADDFFNTHPLYENLGNGYPNLPYPQEKYMKLSVTKAPKGANTKGLVYDAKGNAYETGNDQPTIHFPGMSYGYRAPVNEQYMSNLSPEYTKAVINAQDANTPIGSGFTEHSLSMNSYPLQALSTAAKVNRGRGISTFILPNSNNVVMQPMNGLGRQQIKLTDGRVAAFQPNYNDRTVRQAAIDNMQDKLNTLIKASGGDPSLFPGITPAGHSLYNPQNFFIKTSYKYGGRAKYPNGGPYITIPSSTKVKTPVTNNNIVLPRRNYTNNDYWRYAHNSVGSFLPTGNTTENRLSYVTPEGRTYPVDEFLQNYADSLVYNRMLGEELNKRKNKGKKRRLESAGNLSY